MYRITRNNSNKKEAHNNRSKTFYKQRKKSYLSLWTSKSPTPFPTNTPLKNKRE